MKLCVFGAGSVGGFVGGLLSKYSKTQVAVIARGKHLEAMQRNGLCVASEGKKFVTSIRATDTPSELGVQDIVFLAVKAHSILDAAKAMQPLIGPNTTVVSAQNGIPFWYFYKHGGKFEGQILKSVDPEGKIAQMVGLERVVGCVITSSNILEKPGKVRNIANRTFVLGEPDGTISTRIKKISTILDDVGLNSPISNDIRAEIWLKMWGNISFSPLAVLTTSTLGPLVEDKDLQSLAISIIKEAQAVSKALGVELKVSIRDRINATRKASEHKTSILQDLEAGRPMEVDQITGAVIELANMLGIDTPMTDLIYFLLRQRAQQAGLYLKT